MEEEDEEEEEGEEQQQRKRGWTLSLWEKAAVGASVGLETKQAGGHVAGRGERRGR